MSYPLSPSFLIEPLSKMESSAALLRNPGITTVTFFKGDAVAAEAYFRERARLVILQANPWAAGKVTHNSTGKDNLELVHPKPFSKNDHSILRVELSKKLLNKLVIVDNELQVHSEMSYDQISMVIVKSSAMLPPGNACIDKDILVTRITLVPTINNINGKDTAAGFGLIFSMSHTVADGYTYYRILDMLGINKKQNEEVTLKFKQLSATRKPNLEATDVAWNAHDWNFMTRNVGFVLNIMWSMLFGSKAQCYAFYVDETKIAAAKEEAKNNSNNNNADATTTNVDYVSTNDILVSNHSNLVQPRIQTMAINFRNRVKGTGPSDAGNYESLLLLDKESYASPSLVRRAVINYEADATGTSRQGPLPGFWEASLSKYGQVTNWASFFDDFQVPGCTQELHLPVFDINKIPFDCAVIFKPKAGQTAIMYICTTSAFQNRTFWQTNAPVGELLSAYVFG